MLEWRDAKAAEMMSPRSFLLAAAPLIFLILSGCAASLPATLGGDCHNKTLPALLDSTDLKSLFHEVASELCVDRYSGRPALDVSDRTAEAGARLSGQDGSDIAAVVGTDLAAVDAGSFRRCGKDFSEENQAIVMVTDFADLQTFLPSQSGLLMGELMRSELNDVCGYKIMQAEFAKYFKLSESGLVVLTRHASEIKRDKYSQPDAIVGTYTYLNNNKVLVFVRKINTETGTISRMVTKELSYSCSARSVSGYTVK